MSVDHDGPVRYTIDHPVAALCDEPPAATAWVALSFSYAGYRVHLD